jgi:hypothetical protein
MRPRDFPDSDNGYHNATLGTTGVAVEFPPGASGCLLSVSAGCFIGLRDDDTLITFNDANFGSVLNGAPIQISRSSLHTETHLHIAPWATTAIVAITFL